MICIAVALASAHHCNHHKHTKSTPPPTPNSETSTQFEIPDPIENEAIPLKSGSSVDDHPEFIDQRIGNNQPNTIV